MSTIVRTTLLSAAFLVAVAPGPVTAGTPFGGDDSGTVPADSPKGPVTKCEGHVVKGISKLVGAVIKCHASRASGKLANDAAEDACEVTAKTKFEATKTTGCGACTNLTAIAGVVESIVDSNNALVACTATGTPYGGDDTGNIPADAPKGPETKCEAAVGKAVGKLVTSIGKCHISESVGKLANDAAEEPCETTAKTKFMATKIAGCPSCIDLAHIASVTELQADMGNALAFCASPSGAFLE